MKRREKEVQRARVLASANTFELRQDVDEELLADGSTRLNLEKRGAASVVLPTTMPRIALERRRISLELLVEMVARVMESVPIQSRRFRR